MDEDLEVVGELDDIDLLQKVREKRLKVNESHFDDDEPKIVESTKEKVNLKELLAPLDNEYTKAICTVKRRRCYFPYQN